MKLWKSQAEFDRERRCFIVTFPSPLPVEQVQAFFRVLASTLPAALFDSVVPRPSLVIETWAESTGITYRLLVPWQLADQVTGELRHLVPGAIIVPDDKRPRPEWGDMVEVGLSNSTRTINADTPEVIATDILSALAHAMVDHETALLQWIIAPAGYAPLPGDDAPSTRYGALSYLSNQPASKSELDDRRRKLSSDRYLVIGRIAARAKSPARAQYLVNATLKGLRTASGTASFKAWAARADMATSAVTPWRFPAALNVEELSAVSGFPLGAPTVPGLPRPGARHLYATDDVVQSGLIFGVSNHPNQKGRGIAQAWDTPSHLYIGGRTGCLHPNTPIYDPVDRTTKTVKQRYLDGRPFYVFSMRGQSLVVAQAEPPVEYRRVGMYRLHNDEHSVVVTGQHRVWNGSSYVEVGDLYSQQLDAEVRLPTISACDLSKLQQDVRRSMRTREGSLDGYHPFDHLYGQPLRQAASSDQASSPLQGGVHAPCLQPYDMGGQGRIPECSHPRPGAHQSARSSSSTPWSHGLGLLPRVLRGTAASGAHRLASLGRLLWRSALKHRVQPLDLSSPLSTSGSESAIGFPRPYRVSPPSPVSLPTAEQFPQGDGRLLQVYEFPVSSPQIISPFEAPFSDYFTYSTYRVEQESDETYYDFHVPVYENYLACGLIHHNTGKSVMLANNAAQHMRRGHGVVVLDASNSNSPETLFNRVVEYVPRERLGDVVVMDIAASTNRPVGLNLLDQTSPHMVTDQLGALIAAIYADTKGVWTSQLIYNGMYALIEHGGCTLTDLVKLIRPGTEELAWYREVVKSVTNPNVRAFFTDWDSHKPEERIKRSQPLWDRLWQLNNRPEVHNILGQTRSSFKLRDVLEQNKILLINLAGLPEDTAALLGTLITRALWVEAQGLTPNRPNFIYLDELQQMTRIDIGLNDMLSRGRKHGFFLTMSTQYLNGPAISDATRLAIVNHAATKILLTSSNSEAKFWLPEFSRRLVQESDITELRKYDAIARINGTERISEPVTFTALAPLPSAGTALEARAISDQRFGRSLAEVEADIARRLKIETAAPPPDLWRKKVG